MNEESAAIESHYSQNDLSARILEALVQAGKDPETLALEDLFPFDQLHAGGVGATRALGGLAGLQAGSTVLDIGSGLGGPARVLAAEFGCRVIGLDLTDAFVRAAEMLTERVRLSNLVTFRRGDALDLPFEDESFDIVWTQSTLMNIPEKGRLLHEAYRVLRPGGSLAAQGIFQGAESGVIYPVYWAEKPALSFLVTADEMRSLAAAAGFGGVVWKDMTAQAITSGRKLFAALANSPTPLGLSLVLEDVPRKAANVLSNFERDRLVNIQAVFQKP